MPRVNMVGVATQHAGEWRGDALGGEVGSARLGCRASGHAVTRLCVTLLPRQLQVLH